VFKNNDIVELREVTETELFLYDGRRMRCCAEFTGTRFMHLSGAMDTTLTKLKT